MNLYFWFIRGRHKIRSRTNYTHVYVYINRNYSVMTFCTIPIHYAYRVLKHRRLNCDLVMVSDISFALPNVNLIRFCTFHTIFYFIFSLHPIEDKWLKLNAYYIMSCNVMLNIFTCILNIIIHTDLQNRWYLKYKNIWHYVDSVYGVHSTLVV